MSGNKSIMAALAADGIVKQKLHVILVVDTSRSMQGERIDQVNEAITISFGLEKMQKSTTGFAHTAVDGERPNVAAASSDIPASVAVSDIRAVTDAGNGSVLT